MEVNEINKCLSRFNVSVRRKDGSFYNLKTGLLSVRAALDHHLKSPPHNKNVSSATTVNLFSEANKGPNSYLKQLIFEGNLQKFVNRRSHQQEIVR